MQLKPLFLLMLLLDGPLPTYLLFLSREMWRHNMMKLICNLLKYSIQTSLKESNKASTPFLKTISVSVSLDEIEFCGHHLG